MIENTPIETTLKRAFAGLEIMLGCQTTAKTKKKCNTNKCKTSGFVPNKKATKKNG